MPTRSGSFRLFKLFGIEVFLHWSWFLVAVYGIQARKGEYTSITWNILEYVSLFLIVLIHEFGHALACRSVGGQANQIVLWPFGGVAYVSPPQRPGAQLWSIAAGPLVNVILVPILTGLLLIAGPLGLSGDAYTFTRAIWVINLCLLIFNMLPIYPLDGGQILRSLLWFMLGRARSLMVASIIGFIGIAGLVVLVILEFLASPQSGIWLGLLCVFIFFNCYQGFIFARQLLRIGKAPRREGYHCPNCKAAPPLGDFWTCGRCRKKFDPFASHLMCPHCQTQYARMACLECGAPSALAEWTAYSPPPHFGAN
jgi:Zn-dependent protease